MKSLYFKVGILGSGQLGRMFTQSACNMGVEVSVYSPDKDSPASKAGAREFVGEYTNFYLLEKFLQNQEALSFEFENIPQTTLEFLAEYQNKHNLKIYPHPRCVQIAQNRKLEKNFFKQIGLPVTSFFVIESLEDLNLLPKDWEFPCILKTNLFGYDGKGQWKVSSLQELRNILEKETNVNHILEKIVPFDKEISVIGVRFSNGQIFCYPPVENIHTENILDISIYPARILEDVKHNALRYATKLLESLDYVGVLGLEMFLVKDDLYCNEFAPRPHNSGHFTMDACRYSQFDMQALTLLEILPSSNLELKPTIMKNIIGESFFQSREILNKYLNRPDYKVYLYQKSEARKGRKMGHINFSGSWENSKFEIGHEWKP
ncbi:MAG: 5-(carboxyamino)imidazole ribonucleotide synthase [Leptospiraceae bacterium]|nr:5-(carboxyamino)imidazole ribonucleotide synthase [Leptospiraceae bacterium]